MKRLSKIPWDIELAHLFVNGVLDELGEPSRVIILGNPPKRTDPDTGGRSELITAWQVHGHAPYNDRHAPLALFRNDSLYIFNEVGPQYRWPVLIAALAIRKYTSGYGGDGGRGALTKRLQKMARRYFKQGATKSIEYARGRV